METKSLYIHIPFCHHICSYCDFCKVYYQEEIVEQYLIQLQREIGALSINQTLRTIYIGGGTPSSLTKNQLQTLMEIIQPYIGENTIECCMEVNPESMSYEKLEVAKKGRINRLSIGVQTFNEELASNIERKHTNAQVFTLLEEATSLGFDNLSIDLMYGLPNQTIEDVQRDLDVIASLPIQHISYYALILEEHTQLMNTNYRIVSYEEEEKMQQLIDTSLETMGFLQYEVSNYAKPGFRSQHNLQYWRYENYYGVGIGATGKIDDKMYEHNRNVFAYNAGKETVSVENVSKEDTIFNHIMMSLRILEGIDINKMNQLYKIDFMERYQEVVTKYVKKGWLIHQNNHLACTKESLQFLHTILLDFMD